MAAEPSPARAGAVALAPRVPGATYRLQLHQGFTFDDARRLVPYLDALGVTDLYASPYLRARPGSSHGYDIVDHSALNPEIGTEADHAALCAALEARGMGQILDVVPNHMGISHGQNRWWRDVLENGPGAAYADFFDIDWDPVKRELANRVLLPILADQYGQVLESGELVLTLEGGGFQVRYHDLVLPISPESATDILAYRLDALAGTLAEGHPDLLEYQSILTGLRNLPARTETAPERVAERTREAEVLRRRLARLLEESEPVRLSVEETVRVLNGKRGDPRSFDLLDRLLDRQVYRLAYWRVAADEVNYRRFFDINELAALRMERPAVFRETHRLILRFVEEGKVTGLRVDHPDGLHDPARYFLALQQARLEQLSAVGGSSPAFEGGPDRERTGVEGTLVASPAGDVPAAAGVWPLYVLAEKVLGRGERMPTRWAIHGTTGYEFLATVGGLFVDPGGARPLTATYRAFTGLRTLYPDVVYASKQLILDVALSSELAVLGRALARLAERQRHSRDFTLRGLIHALREVIACFPLYRTYIDGTETTVELQDRACVEVAVAFAKRRNPATSASIFDFVKNVLLLRDPDSADEPYRQEQRAFVRKFQQVTAPVTAKGLEDTAFYRYNRLVSLNEVGSDPDRFGVSVEEFHQACATRQARWAAGLSATSTHDTKRSEDVRARISVLSELPTAWRSAVGRWHRLNQRHLTVVDGHAAPDRNDEYLLYQTLVGTWPLGPTPEGALAGFADRIQAYLTKATREAKVHTSWVSPNAEYEAAIRTFVTRLLEPAPGNRFLLDFAAFHEPIARLGMLGSLAQTLLKICAPGVPDFYQGTELWNLCLVDPDNRGPVDFEARARILAELSSRLAGEERVALAKDLLTRWRDGHVKLYLIHQALQYRRRRLALFREGEYVPLAVAGSRDEHVCAFARRRDTEAALVVVPRLCARLTEGGRGLPLGDAVWSDTVLALEGHFEATTYRELFTGASVESVPMEGGGRGLRLGALLADFPVALLEPSAGSRS